MKSKVVFLVLISAACVSALQTPDNWSKYTSPEGRYSILFPGEPRLMTQEAPNAEGEQTKQYLAASAMSSGAACIVGYFDIRPGLTFSFDKGRDGMLAAVKGTLLAEKTISLGDSPGRELRIAAKGSDGQDFSVVARYYQVDNRVYVIQFIVLKSSESTMVETRARYLDSFQATRAR